MGDVGRNEHERPNPQFNAIARGSSDYQLRPLRSGHQPAPAAPARPHLPRPSSDLHCRIVNYHAFILRDPQICGGEPVIRGTRVTLRTILASLAEGATVEEILADFPTLTPDAVRAVIAFAASSVSEDLPLPATPTLG